MNCFFQNETPLPLYKDQKSEILSIQIYKEIDWRESTKIYYEKPVEAAEFWIKKGTKRLHIVDLDGALQGSSVNLEVILEIRNAFPDLQIQVGGGIRSFEAIENYFNNNIDFLILGSVAIKDKDFFIEACRNYPNKIIFITFFRSLGLLFS